MAISGIPMNSSARNMTPIDEFGRALALILAGAEFPREKPGTDDIPLATTRLARLKTNFIDVSQMLTSRVQMSYDKYSL